VGGQGELACGDGSLFAEGNRRLLDSNGDASVNLTDAIQLLRYLFLGGDPHVLGTRCVRLTGCPAACVQ